MIQVSLPFRCPKMVGRLNLTLADCKYSPKGWSDRRGIMGQRGACACFPRLTLSRAGRCRALGRVGDSLAVSRMFQFHQATFRKIPREKGGGLVRRFAPFRRARFEIPTQPFSRVDFPFRQRGKDRKHHHRQTTGPLGAAAVVVLATDRRVANGLPQHAPTLASSGRSIVSSRAARCESSLRFGAGRPGCWPRFLFGVA